MNDCSKRKETFLFLLQIGRHKVVKEHDELGIHRHTDVICEFGHHAALHLGFAVGV